MTLIGIDLSGPGNPEDTVAVAYRLQGDDLECCAVALEANDHSLFELVSRHAEEGPVAVGLDAPLSYQSGGGDRPGDRALRKVATAAGLSPGSVMPPTLTRMAYLTLRGMAVARLLEAIPIPSLPITEVHPGAALALREAPIAHLKAWKRESESRLSLLSWLEARGLSGAMAQPEPSDHYVAACACVLALRDWHQGTPRWCQPASPPEHPYDYIA